MPLFLFREMKKWNNFIENYFLHVDIPSIKEGPRDRFQENPLHRLRIRLWKPPLSRRWAWCLFWNSRRLVNLKFSDGGSDVVYLYGFLVQIFNCFNFASFFFMFFLAFLVVNCLINNVILFLIRWQLTCELQDMFTHEHDNGYTLPKFLLLFPYNLPVFLPIFVVHGFGMVCFNIYRKVASFVSIVFFWSLMLLIYLKHKCIQSTLAQLYKNIA